MSRILASLCLIAVLLCGISSAGADVGVVQPFCNDEEKPAEALSLDRLEARVQIDHGMAQVSLLYIFSSHDQCVMEGRFRMLIPDQADISSFAVWDGPVRIPGVIVEKVKARRMFEQVARQNIDPGLLSSQEETTEVNEFTARIFPIPPFGAKRMELTYRLPALLERGQLNFVLPLMPNEGEQQTAAHLVLDLEVANGLPLENLAFHGARIVPQITKQDAQGFQAHFSGQQIALDEDLSFTADYKLSDTTLDLEAFRDLEHVDWNISPDGGGHFADRDGYFLARLLFAPRHSAAVGPRQVVLLVDGSLSMLGDKLDRTVELINALCAKLSPADKVTLLYANTEAQVLPGGLQPVSPQWLAAMEQFLRGQRLAGGIDLQGAVEKTASLFASADGNILILLTDGHPTAGELRSPKIVEALRRSTLIANKVRLFSIGIGDDANKDLLAAMSAAADGYYTWCMDTADTQALGELISARMAAAVIRQVELVFSDPGRIIDAYPSTLPSTFAGSETTMVGRYNKPGPLEVELRYRADNEAPVRRKFTVDLPEKSTAHEGIRRIWAKARVDYLLSRIAREGEKKEWIDEIVNLSKRFTFVTPYTSFLAAPRALLRPRVIQPGDPILRVRTDHEVTAVTALFPFGLVAPMTYLPDEDVWQVRFLAPPGYPDGTYTCRLLLVDRDGRQFVAPKTFVLDGTPPRIRAAMNTRLAAGGRVRIAVYADEDARTIYARLPYTASAALRYDAAEKASVGYLDLPSGAPPGPARLEIYAEDFAHNVSRTQIPVEVVHE